MLGHECLVNVSLMLDDSLPIGKHLPSWVHEAPRCLEAFLQFLERKCGHSTQASNFSASTWTMVCKPESRNPTHKLFCKHDWLENFTENRLVWCSLTRKPNRLSMYLPPSYVTLVKSFYLFLLDFFLCRTRILIIYGSVRESLK